MQFPIRDKLSYPAGVAPGFDASHVAARKPAMSCIASGANFINLLNGKPGVITSGSPVAKLLGGTGPATYCSDVTPDQITVAGVALDNVTFTVAVIVQFSSVNAFRAMLSTGDGASAQSTLQINAGDFYINSWGGPNVDSTIPVLVNTPFFVACSVNPTNTRFVVKNLATGAVQSSVVATTASGASSGNFTLGAGGGQLGTNGAIAAAMGSAASMSIAEMLQWAEDPWSFWYPRREPDIFSLFKGGSAGAIFNQTITVGCASTVSLTKSVGKKVAVTCTGAVSLVKATAKSLAIGCTSAVTRTQQTAKALAVACAASVVVTKARTVQVAINVACASTVSLVKSVGKSVAVSCAGAVTRTNAVAKKVAITCASSVTLSAIRVFLVTINVGCTTTVAAVRKSVGKQIAVACSGSVTYTKAITKSLAIGCASSVGLVKSIGKRVTVTVASSVTLSAIRVFLVTINVGCSSAVTMTRRTAHTVAVACLGSVTYTKAITKTITVACSSFLSFIAAFISNPGTAKIRSIDVTITANSMTATASAGSLVATITE